MTYTFDITKTSRHEIEEEIVSGALANSSMNEQMEAYGGDVDAVAAAFADYYTGEGVQFVNTDGATLNVADYVHTYIERQAGGAQ